MQAKIMQAISSIVRNYDLAESIFCQLEQAPTVIQTGLESTLPQLQTRTLFFLRALVTSDTASDSRIQTFEPSLCYMADHFLQSEVSLDIRELSIALLEQLLEQNKYLSLFVQRKDALSTLGIQRVNELRQLTREDKELAQNELEHWERFLGLLYNVY